MRLALVGMTVLLLCVPGAVYGVSISVYMAGSGVVTSPAVGGIALTETFSSNRIPAGLKTTTLTTRVGTVALTPASALRVQAQDLYGGAGNSGQYAVFGAQSQTSGAVTLNLTTKTTFFGMWMSALDPNNGVTLHGGSGGSAWSTRFSAADLTNLLGPINQNKTIYSYDGTMSYSSQAYLGKPETTNPKLNPNEYYAYVMFKANGLDFDRLVFDNSGSAGSGFEMDNWQVRSGNYTVPGTSVLVRDINIVTPEPDVWVPAALGLGVAVYWRRRKKIVGGDGEAAAE